MKLTTTTNSLTAAANKAQTTTTKANNMNIINKELITAMASLKKARSASALITAFTAIKLANGIKTATENDYLDTDYKGLMAMKKTLLSDKVETTTTKPKKAKTPSAKQVAKAAIKAAAHNDYNEDTSNLIDTLHTITENKAEVKKIQTDIKQDVKTVIPLINSYVKTMRDENVIYKNAKKATLVKLIKTRLDSKENVIAVMCDVLIEGINIDNSHSLAIIKYTVKNIKNGNFTKSQVNKADKAKLIKMCESQKAKDALERAKKLIKG